MGDVKVDLNVKQSCLGLSFGFFENVYEFYFEPWLTIATYTIGV